MERLNRKYTFKGIRRLSIRFYLLAIAFFAFVFREELFDPGSEFHIRAIIIILLIVPFFMLAKGQFLSEVTTREDRITLRNIYGLRISVPYKRIIIYDGDSEGDAGTGSVTFLYLKWCLLPLMQSGIEGSPTQVEELLKFLEEKTGKQRGSTAKIVRE